MSNLKKVSSELKKMLKASGHDVPLVTIQEMLSRAHGHKNRHVVLSKSKELTMTDLENQINPCRLVAEKEKSNDLLKSDLKFHVNFEQKLKLAEDLIREMNIKYPHIISYDLRRLRNEISSINPIKGLVLVRSGDRLLSTRELEGTRLSDFFKDRDKYLVSSFNHMSSFQQSISYIRVKELIDLFITEKINMTTDSYRGLEFTSYIDSESESIYGDETKQEIGNPTQVSTSVNSSESMAAEEGLALLSLLSGDDKKEEIELMRKLMINPDYNETRLGKSDAEKLGGKMELKKIGDITTGDWVDLSSCPFMKNDKRVQKDYFKVLHISVNNWGDHNIALYFDLERVAYGPETKLLVKTL